MVRDEWTWYRGRGCEDGRAGGQEDECEDCDGEWFMCLHGERLFVVRDGVEKVRRDVYLCWKSGNNECLRDETKVQICRGSTAGSLGGPMF